LDKTVFNSVKMSFGQKEQKICLFFFFTQIEFY